MYIHTCTCTCTHAFIYTYMDAHVCLCAHIHVHSHTLICLLVWLVSSPASWSLAPRHSLKRQIVPKAYQRQTLGRPATDEESHSSERGFSCSCLWDQLHQLQEGALFQPLTTTRGQRPATLLLQLSESLAL